MTKIDDAMLIAFADGELDGDARAAVERALEDDPALRAKLEAQKRLRSTLSAHYGPVATEDVPDRLLAMLGAGAAGDSVVSLSAARERRKAHRRDWRNYGAIAATLAVGILAGHLIPQGGGPVGTENGMLVAQGPLAAALETQLASAQPANAATRIGVSFEDREGRFCRTFDGAALSGLACRSTENWTLVMTAPPAGAASTQYRQAGSPPILEAARQRMAGAPLDAAAERAAREAGWRIRQ